MLTKYLYAAIAGLLLAGTAGAQQFKKIDTTVKFGDVGYHVTSSNKKPDANPLYISPIGFKGSDVRPVDFIIKARIGGVAVDDLNDDGYPELMVFVYGGANGEIGNVICLSSVTNTDIQQVGFPDIYNDPKLREGYKGFDEFKVVIGTLLRTFPIFKPDDTDTPTGGKRVVQYKVMAGEGGRLVFKVLRSYEKQD